MRRVRAILFRVVLVALVGLAGWGGYRLIKQLPERRREIPTTVVRRGDVVVRVFTRGELRAVRSVTLTAPNLFGTVQVTRLAPLGAYARRGDLVAEFDDAEVRSRLEERLLDLEQIEQRIKKAEADLAIQKMQDEVELLQARYAVRRAELEVQRNELISAIDAKKNLLNLEEAKRRYEKLQSDIESRRKQREADLAVLRENRRRAQLEVEQERRRLRQVKLLAPMDGLVAIRQARTFFFFSGMQLPDIREGDELRPGMPVLDILDLSEMEVVARVGEIDRANLEIGRPALIRLDALPDKPLHGRIKSMSSTATSDPYSNDPTKKFDVTFEVDMKELLTAVGATPKQIEQILAARQKRAEEEARRPRPAAGGFLERILSRVPEDQRDKAKKAIEQALGGKKFEDLSDEERRALMQRLRSVLGFPRGPRPGAGGEGGEPGGFGGAMGGMAGPGGPPSFGFAGPGMPQGGGGFGGFGGFGGGGAGEFTDEELAKAQLPPPPEENSGLEILLRPGLLADVEVIVERIPDAIYIPAQAVFNKNNRWVVYVKRGEAFEERQIKPLKQSESTVVVAEGLQEGEIVALADPTAKPGEKRSSQPAPSGGGGAAPIPGMGGGGGGPGGPRGRM